MTNLSDYYSADYASARERFLAAAKAASARSESLPLLARGPNNLLLTIDIAWLGTAAPRRVIVHQSGVHGVEAFASSAIQLYLLKQLPVLSDGMAFVFVHVLNPYGMAWLRRTNENNVDLNRNCLNETETWSGATEEYRKLDDLINPKSPPSQDLFLLRVLLKIALLGFNTLKQALAVGQYDYPQGLFYGGSNMEQGPYLYQEWLKDRLNKVEQIFVIDVHTGLGKWNDETLFIETPTNSEELERLNQMLGKHLVCTEKESSPGYKIGGGIANLFTNHLADKQLIYIIQEFGTCHPLKVLHALREENRCHFFGRDPFHDPVKSKLKTVFCPPSASWREKVLQMGVDLGNKAVDIMST